MFVVLCFLVPVATAILAIRLILDRETRTGGAAVYALAMFAICRAVEIAFTRPLSMDDALGRGIEIVFTAGALPAVSLVVFAAIAASVSFRRRLGLGRRPAGTTL